MWLLHMEETDGVKIMPCRNCREYKLPELPCFGVDGYCLETRTIYKYSCSYFRGHTSQPFRDVLRMNGETLAERNERTMWRLKQITRAGYLVNVQWECELDDAGRPKLLAQPVVQQSPLHTRDALYGG